MTARQIKKKLEAAGIDMETIRKISRDEITVAVMDGEDYADYDLTEKALKAVQQVLPWDGFQCGWGGWVLQNNYQSLGDWNDRSSRHHY